MATGLAPGFSYSGRRRMSYGEVKNLARAFGLPGDAIAQIAKGESGMFADIQQRDPGDGMVGYGLLQPTPNAWGQGSAARRYMEKLGGIGAMKDPVKNMAMARFLYKSAGNKLTPWYGTRYLTNRSGEGTLGKIDRSRVPKVFGDTSGASLGGGGGGASGGQTTTSGQPDFGSQASQLPLIQALLGSQQQAAPSASIQAPDFTAHAVMPQGFGTVSTGASAPQKPDIGALAATIKTLGGSVPSSTVQNGQVVPTDDTLADAGAGQSHRGGASTAIAWATSKVGAPGSQESGGENHGKLADFLNSRFGMSGQPWCAMFTSAAVTKGGAPSTARTASVAQVRQKAQQGIGYERGFIRGNQAKPGDLILFGNDHIGMVKTVGAGKVFYVGGNQSDGVHEASTSARGATIVRPKYGQRRR